MKRHLKGILSFLIVVVMVFSVSSAMAKDPGGKYGSIEWSLIKGVLTIEGTGKIPNDGPWNKLKSKVKELVIGEGITGSDTLCFQSYNALKKVTFCSRYTYGHLFQCKNIKEIRFTYNNPIFRGTGLGLSRLDNVIFDDPDADYLFEGNMLFSKDKTKLYYYFGSKTEDVIVPEGVTDIMQGAFTSSSIKSIELPSTLENIKSGAFSNCQKLKSITLPSSIKTIGSSAFELCKSLKNVVFCGENIEFGGTLYDNDGRMQEDDGACVFNECMSLEEVTLPPMEVVPHDCFINCKKLKNVAFSEGTKSIEDVFYGCKKLTTVFIPSSARFEHTLLRSAKKVTILCKKGSFAEKTAQDYGIKYSVVDE